MSATLLKSIVAALRDTAAKTEEKVEHQRPYNPEGFNFSARTEIETYTTDRFDRQYIAGRLIGMADMIEALHPEAKEGEA